MYLMIIEITYRYGKERDVLYKIELGRSQQIYENLCPSKYNFFKYLNSLLEKYYCTDRKVSFTQEKKFYEKKNNKFL